MTVQNNLEIQGNLSTHPLAELLRETSDAKLSGAIKLSSDTNKAIVYLNDGAVVFAVSNARRHRLFEFLQRENKLSQPQIVSIPNFANDLELAANLKNQNLLSESEIAEIFSRQIEEILSFCFTLSGEWIFSPQTRVKESISFQTKISQLLIDYARNLPDEVVSKRFAAPNESFGLKPAAEISVSLLPPEAFLLSRFDKDFMPVDEIKLISGLSDAQVLKILYVLWIGGFLFRQNWQAAFSEQKIADILSAKLSLKKPIPVSKPVHEKQPPPVETAPEPPAEKTDVPEISLEEYLAQVENADNYYEVLDIAPESDIKDIKTRYFARAKNFHPDVYHHEKNTELLQRIQIAFARTAQAYDTLKDAEARKLYDYKIEKQLIIPKPKSSQETDSAGGISSDQREEMANESFEAGFVFLNEEEYESATPLLARAAQLIPKNAKFRAYYGKALSADEKQRYKAESEMQAAIKLDPQNVEYRIFSAQFYIQYNLVKRAEGELKRLLAISPNHSEATKLLKSLSDK